MKKLLIGAGIVLALLWGARESTDPYTYAVSARYVGLGRAVVAYADDALGILSNPAAYAKTDKFQFGISTFTLFSEYKFITLSSVIPTAYGKFGLSYVSLGVDDIPETELLVEGTEYRVRQTGTYKMGDRVVGLAYIVPMQKNFGALQDVDLGVNAKVATSYLDKEESTGVGLDIGTRFSISSLPGYRFGLVAQNVLAPKFKSGDEEASDSAYAMNLRLGVAKNFVLWEQKLMGAADYDNNGVHMGLEYYPDKAFTIRAGLDDFKFTLGLGFKSFTFTGFDYNPYTVALDYAYHIYPEPLENVHLFSFSVLGVTQTKTPSIETPTGQTVSTNLFFVQGTAEPDSEVTVYVNNRLRKVIKAEPAGVWQARGLYLDEGENEIYVNSQYEQYVISQQSNSIKVFCDSLQPKLTTEVFRDGDTIVINALLNKEVKAVASRLPDDKKILLKFNAEKNLWEGRWQVPPEMSDKYLTISTMAVDNNGNKSEIVEDNVSTRIVEYPKDKTIILSDSVAVRGSVGPDIKEIRIDDKTSVPNEDGTFSITIPLNKIGKNRIDVFAISNEGKQTTSSIRILRLQSATDVDNIGQAKRQIVDALSIGYLEKGENNMFYPNDYVTRGEFARALALIRGLPLPNSLQGIKAIDVDNNTKYNLYIKAVLDAGYMDADLNRFRPTAFIRRSEAVVAIVKMDGGLEDKKYSKELPFKDVSGNVAYAPYLAKALQTGIIQSDEYFRPSAILDKVSAAMMLSKSRYALQQINNMYNWKRGYGDFPDIQESTGYDNVYVEGSVLAFDDEKQKLKIISPQDQETIYQEIVTLKGMVKANSVTVNGVVLPANKKTGSFAADIRLNLGKNLITIEGAGEQINLRLLRIKSFNDVETNKDNFGVNSLAMYYAFDNGSLNKDKILLRYEMAQILAKAQNKESNVTDNKQVTWQEALLAVNKFAGLPQEDKTLIKDVRGYQADGLITRGAFLEMLLRTPQFTELLKGFQDYNSYTDRNKPKQIQNRVIESEQENDKTVALNLSGRQNRDFSTVAVSDELINSGEVERTGDSIITGGSEALAITYPPNKFITTQQSLVIKGTARGNNNVKINEQKITLTADGKISQQILLNIGKNTIVVTNGPERQVITGVRLASFSDISNLPEKRSIEYLTTLGYFQEGQNFNPEKTITRQEFAALLVRLLDEKPPMIYQSPYNDIDINNPIAPSIQLLKQRQVITLVNNFEPEKTITRKEAFTWFNKISRVAVADANNDSPLKRIDVVNWFIKDNRVQNQINRLRA